MRPPLAGRSIGELSDGERQKVMIARALAQEPAVMILDEPTAFLDWANRIELLLTLKRIAAEEDKAILISSHDLELVLQIADRFWLFDTQRTLSSGTGRELLEGGLLDQAFSCRYGEFLAGRGRLGGEDPTNKPGPQSSVAVYGSCTCGVLFQGTRMASPACVVPINIYCTARIPGGADRSPAPGRKVCLAREGVPA